MSEERSDLTCGNCAHRIRGIGGDGWDTCGFDGRGLPVKDYCGSKCADHSARPPREKPLPPESMGALRAELAESRAALSREKDRADRAEAEAAAIVDGLEQVKAAWLARLDAGDTTPVPFCGWCGSPVASTEAYKEHAPKCEKNPAVQRAARAEAAIRQWVERHHPFCPKLTPDGCETCRVLRAALSGSAGPEGDRT